MPVYQAVCLSCGKYHEYIRNASNCRDTPECCGIKTDKRILSAPTAHVDIPAYQSPASGKWITSRSERREDFARTGCREWAGMHDEKLEAAKRMAENEAKEDAALDKVVRTAWANLSPSKKAAALAGT